MNIDVDSIIRKIDVKKLIEESMMSSVEEYIDIEDTIDDVLEDEKLKDFIRERVTCIIDTYLSSDDGKKCVIEKFKEILEDSDILIDDRITDIVAEFLKKSLADCSEKIR